MICAVVMGMASMEAAARLSSLVDFEHVGLAFENMVW
jgi:hypothetical protein